MTFCKLNNYIVYMKKPNEAKTLTLSIRVKPEARDRLDELSKVLGQQLGMEVTRAQAFTVAMKEALEKRYIND